MKQQTVPGEQDLLPRERLCKAFAYIGYQIYTLKGWFGSGFLAIKRDDQTSAMIIRQKGDAFELQRLESICRLRAFEEAKVRAWSQVDLTILPRAYNPTRRGYVYKWRYLVRIKELREMAAAEGGTLYISPRDRQVLKA